MSAEGQGQRAGNEEQQSHEVQQRQVLDLDWRHFLLLSLFQVKPENLEGHARRLLLVFPLLGLLGALPTYFIAVQAALLVGLTLLPFLGIMGLGVAIGLQVAIILALATTAHSAAEASMRRVLMWFAIMLSFVTGPGLAIVLGLTFFPVLAFAGTGPGGLAALGAVGLVIAMSAVAATFALNRIGAKPAGGFRIRHSYDWDIFKDIIWRVVTLGLANRLGLVISKSTVRLAGTAVSLDAEPNAQKKPLPKPEQPLEMKILLYGEAAAGKSALLARYTERGSILGLAPTIGVDFAIKSLEAKVVTGPQAQAQKIKLHIWDTAGSSKYADGAQLYIKQSAGVMITYDITDRGSFETVKERLQDIRARGGEDIVIMLVGCKSDLSDERQVSEEEAQAFAEGENILFAETSAITGIGVTHAFNQLTRAVIIEQYGVDARFEESQGLIPSSHKKRAGESADLEVKERSRFSSRRLDLLAVREKPIASQILGPQIPSGQGPKQSAPEAVAAALATVAAQEGDAQDGLPSAVLPAGQRRGPDAAAPPSAVSKR